MQSRQEPAAESLQDVRARLLPENQKGLDRLIELNNKRIDMGMELLTHAEIAEFGRIKRALSSELGGEDLVDRILGEARAQYRREGEETSRARAAHEANRKAT